MIKKCWEISKIKSMQWFSFVVVACYSPIVVCCYLSTKYCLGKQLSYKNEKEKYRKTEAGGRVGRSPNSCSLPGCNHRHLSCGVDRMTCSLTPCGLMWWDPQDCCLAMLDLHQPGWIKPLQALRRRSVVIWLTACNKESMFQRHCAAAAASSILHKHDVDPNP